MHDLLKPDSPVVTQGSVWGTFSWLAGDIAAVAAGDAQFGAVMLMAEAVGISVGQTQTGVVTQYTLGSIGYGTLLLDGIANQNYLKMFCGAAGMVSCFRVISQNFNGSAYYRYMDKKLGMEPAAEKAEPKEQGWVQKKLVAVTDAPANGLIKCMAKLSASKNTKVKQFAEDALEISQRSMFKGSVMGIVADLAYIFDGAANKNIPQIVAGLGFLAAWAISGVSIPKDGQENVILTCVENSMSFLDKKLGSPSKKIAEISKEITQSELFGKAVQAWKFIGSPGQDIYDSFRSENKLTAHDRP